MVHSLQRLFRQLEVGHIMCIDNYTRNRFVILEKRIIADTHTSLFSIGEIQPVTIVNFFTGKTSIEMPLYLFVKNLCSKYICHGIPYNFLSGPLEDLSVGIIYCSIDIVAINERHRVVD